MRLPLADTAAIVVFATVGQLAHDGVSLAGYARDALPLLAAWFAVATAVRLYERGGRARLLATWALGVPLGVLLRGLALERDLDAGQLAFLATTLAFTLLLVAAARAVARRV